MATHSSILAWRIPEEPGRLQSTGSQSWTQLRDYTYTRIQLDDAKNITDSNKSFFLGPHAHLPITGGI